MHGERMDTDILVIGAGPAGWRWRPRWSRAPGTARGDREGRACGRVVARHYERLHLHTVKELSALPGLPFPASDPRYVPRQRVVDYLDAYAARAGIEPRFGRRSDGDRAGRRRRLAHDDGRRPLVPIARGRRHDGCEQPPVRAQDRGRRRLCRPHPAQPRLPQRRGLRRPARARRRHGQHRRRDRARPRRARRGRRALGALAGQHRPSRRARPADPEDHDGARAPADGARRRAGALALRRHRRRPRPLRPAPLARSRRCASCASTATRR